MQKIQLSDHFTIGKILLFALPSIGMQIVDNTYQVADGFFISNFISKDAFAAENMIFPPIALIVSVGLMFGSGASAFISYSLGKGEKETANRQLTLTTLSLFVLSVILSAGLYILMPQIACWVQAPEDMIPLCTEYGRILALMMPLQMLNSAFHPLFIAADRPGLGLAVSMANAGVNIFLDWIMVAVCSMGLFGAALATGLSWVVSAVIGLVFFFGKGNHIHFTKPGHDLKILPGICYNGASEMVDAVSYVAVAMLFNAQLINYIGVDGVDAYAVTEYIGGVFTAVFFGISMSITPVVGYHLGGDNKAELRGVRNNGLILMGGLGLVMTVISIILSPQISDIFVGYDKGLSGLSVEALRVVSFSFLLSGLTTFSSAFFTGMEDGTGSLLVAAVKTLILPLAGVLLFPLWLGHFGIWIVTPVAEVFAIIVSVLWFIKYKRKGIL